MEVETKTWKLKVRKVSKEKHYVLYYTSILALRDELS